MSYRGFTALAVLLLAGCSTVGGVLERTGRAMQSTGTASSSSHHQKCDTQQEKGCVEIRALNFAWSEVEGAPGGLLHRLDRPYGSEREREERAWALANKLWFDGARTGRLSAGKPQTFMIYLYGLNKPEFEVVSAYRTNLDKAMPYGHKVEKVSLERLTPGKVPRFDPRYDLGQPDFVLRIRAEGEKPIGASFQLPWSMVTEKTHILVCSEDEAAYPPVIPGATRTKQGLWLLPSQLNSSKGRGSTRILIPFVFKDDGEASKKLGGTTSEEKKPDEKATPPKQEIKEQA